MPIGNFIWEFNLLEARKQAEPKIKGNEISSLVYLQILDKLNLPSPLLQCHLALVLLAYKGTSHGCKCTFHT